MSDSFDHFVIPKFGGINLDARAHAISPDETDDLCNVWGNGTYFTKRPGYRYIAQMSPSIAYPVFDIKRYALYNPTSTFAGMCHDAIHTLHNIASAGCGYTYWNIGQGVKVGPVALNASGGESRLANRMIPCSDRMYITCSPQAASYSKITPLSTTQHYTATTATAPLDGTTPQLFQCGVWHKQHLFMCLSSQNGKDTHNVRFSDFNLPETFPVANQVAVDPTGIVNSVAGIFSGTEILYIGKLDSIYALTGSTVSDFRLEKIAGAHGLAGCRSVCSIGDMAIGWDVAPAGLLYTVAGTTTSGEGIVPRGIIALKGMQVADIGEKVAPLFDNNPEITGITFRYPVAEYNRKDRYALMLPNGESVSGSADAVVYEKTAEAWFRWKFVSASGGVANHLPTCLSYGPSQGINKPPIMYVGTDTGALGYLDSTLPHDEAKDGGSLNTTNPIDAYWTSSWITRKSFENFKSLEDVFIQGKPNTAGDDPTLSVAVDYSPTFVPIGTFPLREDGTLVSVSGKVNMSRSVKIKISFANNSYGGEVRRVVLAQKGFGIK